MEALDREPPEPPCPICEGRRWLRHDVPVTHPDFGKAYPCSCQDGVGLERRLSRLRRFSNMGRLAEVSFASTDPAGPGATSEARVRFAAAFEAARAYAEQPEGALVFVGGNGAGKTHLAAAVANRLMERGEPVFFTFVPDLLDHLRSAFSPDSPLPYDELFEQVKEIPALVLDDLGAHGASPWAEEKLYQVLNHRILSRLPTVVTCGAQVERLDGRIQSRLLDPRAARILDLGGSARGARRGIGSVEPEMLEHMTFETFDTTPPGSDRDSRETLQAAVAMASNFARAPQGWLVLVGESGAGKTHLAVAVANERLRLGEEVFFTTVPDLLDHLRYTFSPDSRITYDEAFDRVKQTPLLVLDDLSSQTTTAWAREKLYQIITHRHNARLPTVITTRAILEEPNDPVASRLNDARLVAVMPIAAPDYRRAQARKSTSPSMPRMRDEPRQSRGA